MVVWIPFRVVSEDEAGQVMNFIANPLTEVRIAQPTCAVLSGVHLFHDFDQVCILDTDVCPVHSNYVLRIYNTVVIPIDRQEGGFY